jgi:hypothetical protein
MQTLWLVWTSRCFPDAAIQYCERGVRSLSRTPRQEAETSVVTRASIGKQLLVI